MLDASELKRGGLSLLIFIYLLEKYFVFEVPKEEAQIISLLGLLHFKNIHIIKAICARREIHKSRKKKNCPESICLEQQMAFWDFGGVIWGFYLPDLFH